jgi:hypothetical protein
VILQRWAAALAGLVAVLDLVQVLVLAWRPKHWGALGGMVLYGTLAVLVARGSRPALIVVAVMPLVPLSVLVGTAMGLPLPVAPDAAMSGILAVQIAAASAATARLWRWGGPSE